MKYVLLIILALNIVGCATGSDEGSGCTWHQIDGNNGRWYNVCFTKDKKI